MNSKHAELLRKLSESAGPKTPEEFEQMAQLSARRDANKAESIDEIASTLLGIRPEHSDTIYTAHPLMAGVLRKALNDAYDRGVTHVSVMLVERMLQRAT